ncbi:MAG: hypothetical protein ACM33V_06710 [Chloroflexota bacterium]
MKKAVVVASIFAILLSACSQIPGLSPTSAAKPAVDAAAMTSAFETAVVQSLTAQYTPAPVLATETATLPVMVESPTLPPITDTPPVVIPSVTASVAANLTSTPATATGGAANTTPAGTSATSTATLAPGQVTASPTNGIMKYGTLPPEVPFNRITLRNKSKTEAYISLQVTMPDGKYSIIEYPVEGTFKVQAPIGSYLYVAWVGGRKMVGSFKLSADDELLITLYKNKVVVK